MLINALPDCTWKSNGSLPRFRTHFVRERATKIARLTRFDAALVVKGSVREEENSGDLPSPQPKMSLAQALPPKELKKRKQAMGDRKGERESRRERERERESSERSKEENG